MNEVETEAQIIGGKDWIQTTEANALRFKYSCEADTDVRMSNEAKNYAQMIEVDDEACIAEADAEASYLVAEVWMVETEAQMTVAKLNLNWVGKDWISNEWS